MSIQPFNSEGGFSTVGNVSGGNVTGGNLITAGSGGNITLTGGNITGAGNISATGNIFGNAIILKNTDDFAQIVFSSDGGATNNGQIKIDNGTNMVISTASNFYVKQAGSDRIAVTNTNSDFMAATNVTIQSNRAGSAYTWTFSSNGGSQSPVVAYANLTAVAGGRAFVNDANLVAAGNFGAQVSGGASNTVPVWSDGSNWYIG